MSQETTKEWASKRFCVPADNIISYNSGSAYDTIVVKNKADAKKVMAAVAGRTANGGYFHGMELGGITKRGNEWAVMC